MICLVATEQSRDPYKQIFVLARLSLSLSLSLTHTHTHTHTHTQDTYKLNHCKIVNSQKCA